MAMNFLEVVTGLSLVTANQLLLVATHSTYRHNSGVYHPTLCNTANECKSPKNEKM